MLSVAITGLVAAAIALSPWWAAGLALVTALALAAALGPGRSAADGGAGAGRDPVVSPLLLGIVLDVVLATCRYLGHLPERLAAEVPHAFARGFVLTDGTWLAAFVVAPVSLMLLGAYYRTRRAPLGLLLAWWSAIYLVGDGLLQLRVMLLAGTRHAPAHAAGALVAVAQLLVAVRVCQRLLRPHAAAAVVPAPVGLTPRQRNLWSLLFVCGVVVYGAALFEEAGPLPVGVIVASMMGGLVGWRRTTARRPADPATVVPLFLLLLSLWYVHVGEEALTSFNRAIASISGTPWSDRDFTLFIGLLGPIGWFGAAWSLWHRQAFGNFILWFLIVGMILGEPTHLVVFPIMAMHELGGGYGYFSGMYTALFPMIPAIVALVTIVRDHRRAATASRA
jgi:hypothetical protein